MSLPKLFVVVGLCLLVLANAEKLEYHSFEPPFEEVDYGGDRMVEYRIYCMSPSSYSLTHCRLVDTGGLLVLQW